MSEIVQTVSPEFTKFYEMSITELLEEMIEKGVIPKFDVEEVETWLDKDTNYGNLIRVLDDSDSKVIMEPLDTRKVGSHTTLTDNFDESYTFVSDSQEVKSITNDLGGEIRLPLSPGAYFVKSHEGEYTEVWAIAGFVPSYEKTAYRLK